MTVHPYSALLSLVLGVIFGGLLPVVGSFAVDAISARRDRRKEADFERDALLAECDTLSRKLAHAVRERDAARDYLVEFMGEVVTLAEASEDALLRADASVIALAEQVEALQTELRKSRMN